MTPDKLRLDSKQAFATFEKLRTYLKLTVEDILPVIGTTRPTYYSWSHGRKLNRVSTKKIKVSITNLLAVARHPDWQRWDTYHLTPEKRREILHELLVTVSAPVDSP